MFVFRKIWGAFFSWNTDLRFAFLPFYRRKLHSHSKERNRSYENIPTTMEKETFTWQQLLKTGLCKTNHFLITIYQNFRSFQNLLLSRSSRAEVFCKKGVPENFAKFTGKHLCLSLFFKRETLHRCFSLNFAKFSRRRFFIKHLQLLLLVKIKMTQMTALNVYYLRRTY